MLKKKQYSLRKKMTEDEDEEATPAIQKNQEMPRAIWMMQWLKTAKTKLPESDME